MKVCKHLNYHGMLIEFDMIKIDRVDPETEGYMYYIMDHNKKIIATLFLNDMHDIKFDFKRDWKIGNEVRRNVFYKVV